MRRRAITRASAGSQWSSPARSMTSSALGVLLDLAAQGAETFQPRAVEASAQRERDAPGAVGADADGAAAVADHGGLGVGHGFGERGAAAPGGVHGQLDVVDRPVDRGIGLDGHRTSSSCTAGPISPRGTGPRRP